MKGCIVLQGNYSRLGNAIALRLKETYGVTNFCAYIISERAKTFAEKQTDLTYTGMLIDEDVQKKYKNEKIDVSYIRRMEEKYGIPNLWRYIYTDRTILMSMIGSDRPATLEYDFLFSHEDIMKILQVRIKETIAFLEKEKPDFIIFFAIGLVGQMLLYHVAKKMGIRVFNTEWLRLGRKIAMTEDYNTITGVKEIFDNTQTGGHVSSQHLNEARDIIQTFLKSGSLDIGYVMHGQKEKVTLQKRLCVYKTLLSGYFYERRSKPDTYNSPQPPWTWLRVKVMTKIRKVIGYDAFYSQPNWEEDFVFYPLHFEPEASILTIAPYAFDQVTIIENIAKSLPLHFKLYIKEHPSMLSYRKRKYYKKLLQIPNVKLVPTDLSSFEIIKHSKLVAVITGTSGWEGAILGKPVITFGNVFFNDLPFVEHCKNPENMPSLIQRMLQDTADHTTEVEQFISAMLENGYIETTFFDTEYLPYKKLKESECVLNLSDYMAQKLALDPQ